MLTDAASTSSAPAGSSPEHVLGESNPVADAASSALVPVSPQPLVQGAMQAAVEQAIGTRNYSGAPLCRDDLLAGSRRSDYLATRLAGIAWSDARLNRSVDDTLAANPHGDIFVFGYGSLIWNPLLHFTEKRSAKIYGLHRSFCLWSRVNRGTPEEPGLVLGLDRGGYCAGVVFRVERAKARDEFRLMWRREMSTGAYIPKWIKARTPLGTVRALCFVIDHRLPSYAGRLNPAVAAQTIRTASGLYGPCADYFYNTALGLEEHGIEDPRMRAVGEALAAL